MHRYATAWNCPPALQAGIFGKAPVDKHKAPLENTLFL
jgi:hypothetical protein